MKKKVLEQKTETAITDAREVLQIIRDELNQGQLKKLLKNEKIAEYFDRYGVEV